VKYPWGKVAHATITAGDRSAVTDREGKYEIPALDPGSYTVKVELPSPGYEAQAQNVIVAAGETKTVDFYLDFERTVVDGNVSDQDGKPIRGATLSGVWCGNGMQTTVTDEEGYFRFERASPGNRFIRVNAAGYVAQIRDFVAKKGDKTELEFHLTKGSCKAHGTVRDKSGRPLRSEVFLSLESMLTLDQTSSNVETGYYEFSVLPGSYTLLVNAPKYKAEVWQGSILADTKVDFTLEPEPEPRPLEPDVRS